MLRDIGRDLRRLPTSDEWRHALPTIPGQHHDLKSISAETLSDLLRGKYSSFYDRIVIMDCRFAYEYDGGHLPGAFNATDPQDVDDFLFTRTGLWKPPFVARERRAPRLSFSGASRRRKALGSGGGGLFAKSGAGDDGSGDGGGVVLSDGQRNRNVASPADAAGTDTATTATATAAPASAAGAAAVATGVPPPLPSSSPSSSTQQCRRRAPLAAAITAQSAAATAPATATTPAMQSLADTVGAGATLELSRCPEAALCGVQCPNAMQRSFETHGGVHASEYNQDGVLPASHPRAITSRRTCLLFHCEFSKNRGPKMVRHVRKMDRRLHLSSYPDLFYPECYLIDRGYRHTRAHRSTASLCFPSPGAYLSMNDEDCVSKGLCRSASAKLRRAWRKYQQAYSGRRSRVLSPGAAAESDSRRGGSGKYAAMRWMRRSSPSILEGLNRRRVGSVLFGDDEGGGSAGGGGDEKGQGGGGEGEGEGRASFGDGIAAAAISETAVAADVPSPPPVQGRRRSATCDLASSSDAVMSRGRRSLSLFQ